MAIFKSVKTETLRPADYVSHFCGGELTLNTELENDVAFINEQAAKLEIPNETDLNIKMIKVAMASTQAMLEKEIAYYNGIPLKQFLPKTK